MARNRVGSLCLRGVRSEADISRAPNPNCESARNTRTALAGLGRIRKSMSAEYRGNPCQETASAPTTRYSTSFEFKHSINSRKSLPKGIGVGSLSQFKEYAGPLLRGHLSAGEGIGGIGLFEAGENADYFLHGLILVGSSIMVSPVMLQIDPTPTDRSTARTSAASTTPGTAQLAPPRYARSSRQPSSVFRN